MTRQIRWKIKLSAALETVFDRIATDAGRESFLAETSQEKDGRIHFIFPDGQSEYAEILERDPPRRFAMTYFGAHTVFDLRPEGAGCVLTLRADAPERDYLETYAGWVSVLLALKAQADHGVDLRNHDRVYSWSKGFADN